MSIDHLLLVAIGLLAGMLGGLLGIGGSVLMIPAMSLILGPAQHLYQGAAMIVNFFVVLPAVYQHRRAGAIVRPVVRVMIPLAAVSVIAGVAVSHGSWFRGANEVYLSRAFGGFLLYAAAYNAYRLVSSRRLPAITDAGARAIPPWRTAAVVGVPMGLAGGLLGIGGGTLAVPLQQLFLRMPLRHAIANSTATIVPLSLIGATCKNYANAQAGIPLSEATGLALFLIPTAMVGGYLGARLTHVAPRRILRVAVTLLMCYGGIAMIRRPAHVDSPPASAVGVYESARSSEHRGPVMASRSRGREPETRHPSSLSVKPPAVRSSCASFARVPLAAGRPTPIDSTSSP